MQKVMEKLVADYKTKNGGQDVCKVNFDMNIVDSAAGKTAAKGGPNKTAETNNVIGMSSSAVNNAAGQPDADLNVFRLSIEAVAVIVHKDNKIEDISTCHLYDIYSGALKVWGYFA